LKNFSWGEPSELNDTTPPITGGILDSTYDKSRGLSRGAVSDSNQAHETMVDYLNTVDDIAQLVQSKLNQNSD
jgi:hypothetical protein